MKKENREDYKTHTQTQSAKFMPDVRQMLLDLRTPNFVDWLMKRRHGPGPQSTPIVPTDNTQDTDENLNKLLAMLIPTDTELDDNGIDSTEIVRQQYIRN